MEATYKAGVASAVITPKESMWLAGWAVRTASSRGTITDLYAKALALQDERGERFVIITADLVAISREISSAVAREVERRHGLRREQLLFSASHTHTGPEVRPDKVEFFHITPEFAAKIGPYVASLIETLVGLVDRALGSLAPAKLTARQTTAPFAVNRRKISHGVDHHVPILDVTTPTGDRRIAILFGYACHNTTLDPQDRQFSADWAGYAAEQLEREYPGAAAMFIAGAGADQNPDPRFTIELSQRYGSELANAVGESLRAKAARVIAGPMRFAYGETPLAYEPIPDRAQLEANLSSDDEVLKTKSRYLLRAIAENRSFGDTYPCPIQVVRFGDELLMIAIGGEPVIDFAHVMKSEFAGPMVWVAGYCNDMFGYVPTRAVLQEGGYEGGRSVLWSALPMPFASDTEDRVMKATREWVARVQEK